MGSLAHSHASAGAAAQPGLAADGAWYVAPALSARARSSRQTAAVVAAALAPVVALAVAACGGSQRQDAHEPSGRFPVAVQRASFPARQRLAQHTHLVIEVRNAGTRTIPDVGVTICNVTCAHPAPAGQGTSAHAFAANISQPYLANPSRPLWIVERPPGPCGYSCTNGGQGAAVTAYANTWALGRLAPGHTATFDWGVAAVRAGRHVLAWQVAAGLNGKARAVLPGRHGRGSGPPHGTFTVTVTTAPERYYVNSRGQIVTGGSGG